jgi:hypothetical protein
MWIIHISVDLEVYRLHHSEDAAQRRGSCCGCGYKINVSQLNCLFDWILRVKDPVTSKQIYCIFESHRADSTKKLIPIYR